MRPRFNFVGQHLLVTKGALIGRSVASFFRSVDDPFSVATLLMIFGINPVLLGLAFLFGGFETVLAPSDARTQAVRGQR